MRARFALVLPIALFAASFSPVANAQPSHDRGPAQELFNEAKALAAKGDWAHACPKFEESERLDPGIGTLYHLADCYEHIGRTASAWAMFIEVADKTAVRGETERSEVARQRARELEPKLVHLTLKMQATDAGVVVKRDGVVIGQGQLGIALPVDPGPHTFEASAPGKKPWQTKIDVTANAEVSVPPLDVAMVEVQPEAASASNGYKVRRGIGIATAAVGLVGVGLGSFFGVQSMSKKSDGDTNCKGTACNATGLQDRSDALNDGNISTVAFVAGGVLLAGGLVLWLTAKAPSSETGIRAVPMVGAGTGGVLLSGSF